MPLTSTVPSTPRAAFRSTPRRLGAVPPVGEVRRVCRAPAVVDLRRPPVAVWAGEVVFVAAPDPGELCRLLAAARARATPRLRVAEPEGAYTAAPRVGVLAASAECGAGVLVGVCAEPSPSARRALAAARGRVARRVPCRCVWLVGGRVYPE